MMIMVIMVRMNEWVLMGSFWLSIHFEFALSSSNSNSFADSFAASPSFSPPISRAFHRCHPPTDLLSSVSSSVSLISPISPISSN